MIIIDKEYQRFANFLTEDIMLKSICKHKDFERYGET